MALLHAEGRPRLVPKWGGRPSGTEENRNKPGIRTPASSGRTTRPRSIEVEIVNSIGRYTPSC
jgi:hypothetical protein